MCNGKAIRRKRLLPLKKKNLFANKERSHKKCGVGENPVSLHISRVANVTLDCSASDRVNVRVAVILNMDYALEFKSLYIETHTLIV